jgi:hypothetical protein
MLRSNHTNALGLSVDAEISYEKPLLTLDEQTDQPIVDATGQDVFDVVKMFHNSTQNTRKTMYCPALDCGSSAAPALGCYLGNWKHLRGSSIRPCT